MIKLKIFNTPAHPAHIEEYFEDSRLGEVRQMLEKVGFVKVSEQIYVWSKDKSKKALLSPVFVRDGDLDGLAFLLETTLGE
jgi:hypothetical protein